MDNLFINVMPRKTPYGVNGAGTIAQYPEFDKRLKQCADRRHQFLDYFTRGALIGECLLAEDCPDAHVTAYVRPGKILLLILNMSDGRPVSFHCNLAAWFKSPSGGYRIDCYDMDGHLLKTADAAADWQDATEELGQNEIAVYEITVK